MKAEMPSALSCDAVTDVISKRPPFSSIGSRVNSRGEAGRASDVPIEKEQ